MWEFLTDLTGVADETDVTSCYHANTWKQSAEVWSCASKVDFNQGIALLYSRSQSKTHWTWTCTAHKFLHLCFSAKEHANTYQFAQFGHRRHPLAKGWPSEQTKKLTVHNHAWNTDHNQEDNCAHFPLEKTLSHSTSASEDVPLFPGEQLRMSVVLLNVEWAVLQRRHLPSCLGHPMILFHVTSTTSESVLYLHPAISEGN